VTEAPGSSGSSSHVTFTFAPFGALQPAPLSRTNETPAGSWTSSFAPVAVVPPSFATVAVNVAGCPLVMVSVAGATTVSCAGTAATTTWPVAVAVRPPPSVAASGTGCVPAGTFPGGATMRRSSDAVAPGATVGTTRHASPATPASQAAHSPPAHVAPSGRSTATVTSVPVVRPVLLRVTVVSMVACAAPAGG